MTETKPLSFDPHELAGRRALVTGGTRGIGGAITQ
jgi:short-subunit dehydrogenase